MVKMSVKDEIERSPRLRKRIQAGLRDVKAGRVITHDNLKNRLTKQLEKLLALEGKIKIDDNWAEMEQLETKKKRGK
jgi:hypothetical protein